MASIAFWWVYSGCIGGMGLAPTMESFLVLGKNIQPRCQGRAMGSLMNLGGAVS